jgi:hypothetical protein
MTIVRLEEDDAGVFQGFSNLRERACLHAAFAGFEAEDRGFRDGAGIG